MKEYSAHDAKKYANLCGKSNKIFNQKTNFAGIGPASL